MSTEQAGENVWPGEVNCVNFAGIIREQLKGCCGHKRMAAVISCSLRSGSRMWADTACRRQICRKYVMKVEDENRPPVSGQELS